MNTDTEQANIFTRGMRWVVAKVYTTPPPISCAVLTAALVGTKLLIAPGISWGFALSPAMLWVFLLVFQNYATVVIASGVFKGMTNYDQYQRMLEEVAMGNVSRAQMYAAGDDGDDDDDEGDDPFGFTSAKTPNVPGSGSIN